MCQETSDEPQPGAGRPVDTVSSGERLGMEWQWNGEGGWTIVRT